MLEQYKYRIAKKYLRDKSSKVLEVGIGNDAPLQFHKIFPNVEYHGVDKNLDYNLSQKSLEIISHFFRKDLENDLLIDIPKNYYDFLIIAHVIEHIINGESVINELAKKVKLGGGIYIEYPRKASAQFPSMKGTLNFYDDPTHKRFYKRTNLEKILENNGFIIKKSGIKRDFSRIIGLPFMVVKSIIVLKYIRGSVFWDILGFAEFIWGEKIK